MRSPIYSVEVKTADVLKGAQDASESAAGHSSQKLLQSKQAASQVSMKYRVKRISTRTFHSSGDHRGTAHRNPLQSKQGSYTGQHEYRVKQISARTHT